MKLNEWKYIGTGVYAMFDVGGIWLCLNGHENPTDRIYLEWSVLDELTTQKREIFKNAAKNRDKSQTNTPSP
jgi:hypothetical protein